MFYLPEGADDDDEDDDDDLPLAAAAKRPTDDQLVVAVERILDNEDVQTFNIKALMKRLSMTFPPLVTAGISPLCPVPPCS